MLSELPISIRNANENDYGFILATWSREYHKTHPFNHIPNRIYVPYQTAIINKILSQATTIVSHIEDASNDLVGFLTYQIHDADNIIIHYGATKGIFRRLGAMKYLLNSINASNKNLVCSHYFELFKKLKDKYALIYDPTLLGSL